MKKLVLLALLAGSMLASCATAAKVDANHAKADGLAGVFEDTDAHDEIFADAWLDFGPKKTDPDPEAVDPIEDDIPIGVQYREYEKDEVNYRAIRFIAAVGESDTAVWERAVWYNDVEGTENDFKAAMAYASKPSSASYERLRNGASHLYTIEQFNLARSTSYHHFVVYTLGDIPMTEALNGYNVTVSLTLNGSSHSKIVATTIDQTTQFAYAYTDKTAGFFGVKKTASGFEKVAGADKTDAGHVWRFVDEIGNVGDNLLIVNSASDYFRTYGIGDFDSRQEYYNQVGSSKFFAAKYANTGTLYLNTSGHIYPAISSITTTLYVNTSTTWRSDKAWFALRALNNESSDVWGALAKVGETNYYGAEVTFDPFKVLIFVRMRPSDAAGYSSVNSGLNWDNKWTQTGDLTFHVGYNCFQIPEDNAKPLESIVLWSNYSA